MMQYTVVIEGTVYINGVPHKLDHRENALAVCKCLQTYLQMTKTDESNGLAPATPERKKPGRKPRVLESKQESSNAND